MAENQSIEDNPSARFNSVGQAFDPNLGSHQNLTVQPKENHINQEDTDMAKDGTSAEEAEDHTLEFPNDAEIVNPDELIIREEVFERLALEIFGALKTDTTLSAAAVKPLQEAAESVLVTMFKYASLNAAKNKRFTVNSKDMAAAQLLMKYEPRKAQEG